MEEERVFYRPLGTWVPKSTVQGLNDYKNELIYDTITGTFRSREEIDGDNARYNTAADMLEVPLGGVPASEFDLTDPMQLESDGGSLPIAMQGDPAYDVEAGPVASRAAMAAVPEPGMRPPTARPAAGPGFDPVYGNELGNGVVPEPEPGFDPLYGNELGDGIIPRASLEALSAIPEPSMFDRVGGALGRLSSSGVLRSLAQGMLAPGKMGIGVTGNRGFGEGLAGYAAAQEKAEQIRGRQAIARRNADTQRMQVEASLRGKDPEIVRLQRARSDAIARGDYALAREIDNQVQKISTRSDSGVEMTQMLERRAQLDPNNPAHAAELEYVEGRLKKLSSETPRQSRGLQADYEYFLSRGMSPDEAHAAAVDLKLKSRIAEHSPGEKAIAPVSAKAVGDSYKKLSAMSNPAMRQQQAQLATMKTAIEKGVRTGKLESALLPFRAVWENATGGETSETAWQQFIQNISMNEVLGLIERTKGAISNVEFQAFKDATIGLQQTPENNLMLIEMFMALNEKKAEMLAEFDEFVGSDKFKEAIRSGDPATQFALSNQMDEMARGQSINLIAESPAMQRTLSDIMRRRGRDPSELNFSKDHRGRSAVPRVGSTLGNGDVVTPDMKFLVNGKWVAAGG